MRRWITQESRDIRDARQEVSIGEHRRTKTTPISFARPNSKSHGQAGLGSGASHIGLACDLFPRRLPSRRRLECVR